MPTPKKKTSRAKRDMRRSHDFLTSPTVRNCTNCGALVRPHHVCLSCGHYRNREVIVSPTE